MVKKLDIEAVAFIVEAEGLGYAIQSYLSSESIKDDHLRECWEQAKVSLDEIEEILEPFYP